MKKMVILRVRKMMRRILLIVSFLFMFICSFAQLDEVGVFVGTQITIKELPKKIPIRPAYQLIYRHSFNSRLALSGTLTYAVPGFYEVAARYEYNYLNFLLGSKRNYYSTYIFGGLGLIFYRDGFAGGDTNNLPLSIPFGVGYKYSIGESLGLTIEGGLRKDLLRNDEGGGILPSGQKFYGFLGLAITYKFSFANKKKCKNKEF